MPSYVSYGVRRQYIKHLDLSSDEEVWAVFLWCTYRQFCSCSDYGQLMGVIEPSLMTSLGQLNGEGAVKALAYDDRLLDPFVMRFT